MKRKQLLILGIMSLVLILGLLPYMAAYSAPKEEKAPLPAVQPIKIKTVTFVPKTHPYSVSARWMIERIEKATNGQVTFDWPGGPEVFHPFDQPKAIRSGVIGAQFYLPGMYTSAFMPEIYAMPLSPYPSWEERKVGIYDLWEELIAKKMNCKYLGRLENIMPGYYAFTVKRQIKKVGDFKGLTLRVAPLYTPIVTKLGAAPVTLSADEVVSALQRGVIDGQITATMGIHAMGYDEYTKYRIEPGFGQVDNLCLINLDVWNKIPKAYQDAIIDVAKNLEYMYTAHGGYANATDWEMCKQTGMQSCPMEPEEAKKFLELVYDTLWEGVIKGAPEYGPRLKQLMTKK